MANILRTVPFLICFLGPALGQDIVLERVRLEIVRTQRQYDDDTGVRAFQGERLPIAEFEAEFLDAGEVSEIFLDFPNSSITLDGTVREGDLLRLSDFVDSTNISFFRGTYTLRVQPNSGDEIVFTFDVDFDLTEEFPEVRFPIDGLDEVDDQSLDAEWDGFGDSYRLDLFDFPLAGFHRTFRTDFEDFNLGAEVDRDEAYELWIGSTVELVGDTDGDFDVEVWFTSSSVLFFSTGPKKREQLAEYNSTEVIESATVFNRVQRVGQHPGESKQTFIARVEGNRLFDIEVGKIRGRMDGRLENRFTRLDRIVSQQVYEREIEARPGEDYLFLVEFQDLFGSETSEVPQTLGQFPEIREPLSNQSGVGASVDVEWDWSGPAGVHFEVSLREIGTVTEVVRIEVPLGDPRRVELAGLEEDKEYRIEVAAMTQAGAESISCIAISTGKAGDANGDGRVDGKDLFGQTLVWYRGIPENQSFPTESQLLRMDLDGNETVDGRDLVRLLELLK